MEETTRLADASLGEVFVGGMKFVLYAAVALGGVALAVLPFVAVYGLYVWWSDRRYMAALNARAAAVKAAHADGKVFVRQDDGELLPVRGPNGEPVEFATIVERGEDLQKRGEAAFDRLLAKRKATGE